MTTSAIRAQRKALTESILRAAQSSGLWLTLAILLYIAQAIVLTAGLLWKYVDPDQLVEAEMARRYAEGFVPEPYFWGQPYMFPIDSWLAVPVVALGVRADVATMLVTAVAWYAPFVLVQAFLRGRPLIVRAALLLIPLAIPIPLLLVSLMPRNFGAAAGLGAVAVMVIIFVKSRVGRSIAGVFFGIAVAAMPPVGVLAALIIWFPRPFRRAIWPAVFAAVGFAGISLLGLFYRLHPSYVAWPAQATTLSLDSLLDAMTSAVHIHAGATLLFPMGLLLIAVFVGLAISGYAMPRTTLLRAGISAGAAIVIILGLLAVPAINNHTESIYFSFWRYWTALPAFVAVFALACVGSTPKTETRKRRDWQSSAPAAIIASVSVLVIGVAAIGFDAMWLRDREVTLVSARAPVPVVLRSSVEQDCARLAERISGTETYVELDERDDLRAYGCYVLEGVNAVNPSWERRTWLVDSLVSSGYRPVRP